MAKVLRNDPRWFEFRVRKITKSIEIHDLKVSREYSSRSDGNGGSIGHETGELFHIAVI